MEQNLIYSVFFIILLITIYKSEVSLAILLNINVFRALPYVNYQDPRYGHYLENDVLLGAVLPALCFIIMFFKVLWKKKSIKYTLDTFDFFMITLAMVMVLSILISPNKINSVYYTGIFLVLGAPFYFITKLIFINSKNLSKSLTWFVASIVFFALVFSLLSLHLHDIAKYPYRRMTFPGVYPIPFSLFLCLALIFFIFYYIKPKFKYEFSRKIRLLFSLPILAIIAFSIIKTNTRGPIVAIVLSFIMIAVIFLKIKVNPKIILGFLFAFSLGIIILLVFFDINEIAHRFINLTSKDADSFSPRLVGYIDSINILSSKPFGISVGTFGEFYSNKSGNEQTGYAHNLFMELISSFGIIGVLICLLLAILCLKEYYFIVFRQKQIFSNHMFFLTIILLFFFFIETQISFTLNTHKGWYLSMGLYSVFKQSFIKDTLNKAQ